MSLMLNTLKTLESRQPRAAIKPPKAPRHQAPSLRICAVADEPQGVAIKSPPPPASNVCQLPAVAAVAEPFSDLATHVADQLAETPCNVLLFVGCDPVTAGAFALVEAAQAFALHARGPVLLIEGDLCERAISVAAIGQALGLSDVGPSSATWSEVIHSTQVAGLDFVGAGTATRFDDAANIDWQPLRDRYQFVVIGTMRPAAAETPYLAAQADAVYLAVSRRETRCRDAVATLNRLRRAGANVLGTIVVND